MKTIACLLAAFAAMWVMLPSSKAQVLLGNCGADITGIQLSTGNIYCHSGFDIVRRWIARLL